MKKILIIGATSAIAEATARVWSSKGHRLYLIGRSEERLRTMVADLELRGAESAKFALLDVNDLARHAVVLDSAIAALDGIDIVLVAHGTLSDQKACERDFSDALRELNTNLISVISLMTHLANRFETNQSGTIAAICSVAGDRGRQSNYVYATAKGAVALFMQGLRNRLHKAGVHVLTIKPGFVDTPMTAAFKKGPLWATPDAIARSIDTAVAKRRDVVYTPWFWLPIMTIIKCLPEKVFKRASL